MAGSIPFKASQVKTKSLSDGGFALCFVAPAAVKDQDEKHPAEAVGSGLLYDSTNVRFWTSYSKPREEEFTVWCTTLEVVEAGSRYRLSTSGPTNVLRGAGITFAPWLLGDCYDLCSSGLLVRAMGPGFDKTHMFSADLFYFPMNFAQPHESEAQKLGPQDWTGMPTWFTFSLDGKSAAFLQSRSCGACFDHESIFIVNLDQPGKAHRLEVYSADHNLRAWDARFLSIIWSSNSRIIYAIVDQRARKSVWKIVIDDSDEYKAAAFPLLRGGCVTAILRFTGTQAQEKLLVNRSSFEATGILEVLDPSSATADATTIVDECRFKNSPNQHVEVFFQGAGDYSVHTFIHRPHDFDQNKQYPLAILIHGGPNEAWRECWSTAWNPLLWIEQGYVVLTPNISGSLGFGLPFALSIYQDWGGQPYADIERLFAFIEDTMPYIDLSRVIGVGASFGGYMMNWIAGHPLAARFKALIVHGGMYSVRNMLSSDAPVVQRADFGGFPWEVPDVWDSWDPSRHAHNWKTPMLFTHSDLDFRVPVTESLAAFYTCQFKEIPSQLLIFPDEGHILRKPANLILWYRTMLEWANRWVGKADTTTLYTAL
jgi:dipeptidyl aminopeptidase/acylaminoacyl peptidase